MKPHIRKLLPDEDVPRNTLSPAINYSPDQLLRPSNGPSTNLTRRPFRPNSPFDSSMALTALVLLMALLFMGFFSVYIRRFADDGDGAGDPDISSRRRHRPHSPRHLHSSSTLPLWRCNYPKGLDSSAVRSLPLVSYGGDAKHQIDCAICLSEFEERETIKLIPYCGHVFHPECVDTWLSSHVTCPLCRSSRLFLVDEVRSDASRGEVDHGGGDDDQGRSTVERVETWVEVGPVEMRRTCSCPSLGEEVVVLQRSLSFC